MNGQRWYRHETGVQGENEVSQVDRTKARKREKGDDTTAKKGRKKRRGWRRTGAPQAGKERIKIEEKEDGVREPPD